MKRSDIIRHILSVLTMLIITASLLFTTAPAVFFSYAEDSCESAAEETGESAADKGSVKMITYPFLDTAKVAYEWSFPYSDDFFRTSPAVFDRTFAQGSMGLAASAFRSTKNIVNPQYETYLKGAGFTDLYAFGYDQETTQDSLSGIIGLKKVDDCTVIAAVTCGQGYGKEWAGNLKVGTGTVHEGFQAGSRLLEYHISKFIEENKITGKKKLWLTGISRAAAIANLTAADAIESGAYEDVYAYLFGVPRTTKEPAEYEGIYNICGQFDPVCNVPLESWGFRRHGTDIFTPAQESDSKYEAAKNAASDVAQALAGDHYRNNPEINYQLHLVLEFIGRFFPTSEEYADRFQEIIMETWKDASVENIVDIMIESIARMDDLDKVEENAAYTFLDYISYAIGKHTRADTYGIDDGSWNPNEGLDANVVIEHRPSTYVKWLFADLDENSIFRSGTDYRRLMINGIVAIDIYENNTLVRRISAKGKVTEPNVSESDVYVHRDGNNTKIYMPFGTYYQLMITADKDTAFSMIDSRYKVDSLYSFDSDLHSGCLAKGSYVVPVLSGSDVGRFTAVKGRSTVTKMENYHVSTRAMMREELSGVGKKYLSLKKIRGICIDILLLELILLTVTFIVEGINLYWRKSFGDDAHTPAPFLILCFIIASGIFVWLTGFLLFYLYTVPRARVMSATLAVIPILLLSVRGMIRTRSWYGLPVTLGLAVITYLTATHFKDIKIFNQYSVPHMILLDLTAAALAAVTVYFCWQPPEDWLKPFRRNSA